MIERILQFHAQRYPLMQPTDAVKLIYQNEFAVGHLIQNKEIFAHRLEEEIKTISSLPAIQLIEPIGNGLIRVMLNSADFHQVDHDQLISACIRTAEEHHGSMESFLEKLNVLRSLCQNGIFCFDSAELDRYLSGYELQGYPPVSHSTVYRETYHPAYRVVASEYFESTNENIRGIESNQTNLF